MNASQNHQKPDIDERQGLPSASGLWLVARCPGSWSLGRSVKDEPSVAMLEGREIHERIEARLRGESGEFPARNDLTPEQRAQRELLMNRKAEEAASALQQVLEKNQMTMAQTLWSIEQRYWIYWRNRCVGSAKPDYVCRDPNTGRLLVADFKCIHHPRASMLDDIGETADTSIQMWAAVAAWISEAEYGDYSSVQQVKLCYIKIPLWDADAPVTVQESDWFDHNAVVARTHAAVALCLAALDESPVFIPGPHCRWCKAKRICNRRMLPVLIGMSPQAARSAMRLEPSLAALVLAYKGELESLLEGAKEVLLSLPDAQLETHGWRKALPTNKEQVTSALAAFQLLQDAGVSQSTLLEACSMSLKTLAESVAAQRGISVGEAKDWLKSMLGHYVEMTTNAPRLIRVKGSPRPELEPPEEWL